MSKEFKPMLGAGNAHIQTLIPRLVRKTPDFEPYWQRLELPDGDFVDLAWTENPENARQKPRAILFHGLEGSVNSPYAHGLLSAYQQQGWLGVVMHFRGCASEPNRKERIYHSGETQDARYFINWLESTYGKVPTVAAGFSLGGNMLACYLAEQGENCTLAAAVIVSAPLMLAASSYRLEKGLSRIYHNYLLGELKKTALRKLAAYPNSLPVSEEQIENFKLIREFDNAITAPIHGFLDADDYYECCSALPYLSQIKTPLLIIHSADDPFMAGDVIPDLTNLPENIEYQLTRHGGHVGFVSGSLLKPKMWLEERIPAWLAPYIEQQG